MNDKKKKHYPKDPEKLHALLEKKEQDLIELQEEVKYLRIAAVEADHRAIHTTAEAFSADAGLLHLILTLVKEGQPIPPEVAAKLTPIRIPDDNNEEEDEMDDPDNETEV